MVVQQRDSGGRKNVTPRVPLKITHIELTNVGFPLDRQVTKYFLDLISQRNSDFSKKVSHGPCEKHHPLKKTIKTLQNMNEKKSKRKSCQGYCKVYR
jgi:hypothetical protein